MSNNDNDFIFDLRSLLIWPENLGMFKNLSLLKISFGNVGGRLLTIGFESKLCFAWFSYRFNSTVVLSTIKFIKHLSRVFFTHCRIFFIIIPSGCVVDIL